ncbi:MAG: AAA family ATPase, partial [Chloroflexi bacterium]|nr:AAA family ATPase [Chloroflexota bacterium]
MNKYAGDFVGRERELAALVSALDSALAGQGRLVMLVGEPGIGKTRTAQELASIGEQRGANVLWGRCYEREGAPPYWPWLQILRAFVQQTDAGTLQSQMADGAADIAEVLPELGRKLPNLQPPPQLGPEQARFRLFDSITAFFKRTSEKRPVVLVLDDLHWADASSLRLLEFFAQELSETRLLVVGTYRDIDVSRGHPLYHVLGALGRLQCFRRVLFRGLSEEEVGQVIELAGGVKPSRQLVAKIHQETEGNPLFVGEVVRLLAQEGRLESVEDSRFIGGEWDFRLPEGVREVIGRRLDALSADCNEALRVASVIGRDFSLDQLARLVDASEDSLLASLEEAIAARIIEELPRSMGRYQFSHALIRQTLESELTTTRRVRLHARILDALEELGAHAAELARHAVEAEAVIGPGKLVRYSATAGEQALAAFAWEDARLHFERALAGKEGQPMDAETAAIVSVLGRSLAALNQHEQAAANLKRAFAYYAEVGDVARAVATVDYPHNIWLNFLMKDTL